MKKLLLSSLVALASFGLSAQTTINFDDATKWSSGSGYGIYTYTDGLFSATGGDGLRQSAGTQDGFPSAHGTYSWRLRNNSSTEWIATISAGGVSTFSIDARRWDGSPSPDFAIDYSTDGGSVWMAVDTINNATLNSTSDWPTFNGTINSSNANIKIRLKANGTTERIMIDDFTWSPVGGGVVIDTIAAITSIDTTVYENVGTVNVSVSLNQVPTIDKTVDLALVSGNAAVIGNYTTQTITFVGGGATTQNVTLNITSGQLSATTETFDFMLVNPSADLVLGLDTTYQLTVKQMPVDPAPCSDLYFSEYIEGSSSNKAFEIFNPTTQAIDLSAYSVYLYKNGGASPFDTLNMVGMLANDSVYIAASPTADSAGIRSKADTLHSICYFNGNDALALYHGSTLIDVIGEIGVNPGTSWSVDTGSTKEYTLVRKPWIVNGSTWWNGQGDTQWIAYSQNDFSHLGSHSTIGCQAQIPLQTTVTTSADTICENASISFTSTTTGGTAPYTYIWDFGDGGIDATANPSHTYTTAGSYSVNLLVIDDTNLSDDTTFTIVVENCTPLSTSFVMDNDTICLGDAVQFTSTTTGGTAPYTYAWDFGDNGSAATQNPSYTYNAVGSYAITLNITDDAGDTTSYSTFVLVDDCSSIKENSVKEVTIYPNPTNIGSVTLSNIENNSSIVIYNVIGEVVLSKTINNNGVLSVEKLDKGNYFIKITANNSVVTKKLIIK